MFQLIWINNLINSLIVNLKQVGLYPSDSTNI